MAKAMETLRGIQVFPKQATIHVATVLILLMELVQAFQMPLVGAGTEYARCFDLIPQSISRALMEEQGIDEGYLLAISGMYRLLRHMFKIVAICRPPRQPKMGYYKGAHPT